MKGIEEREEAEIAKFTPVELKEYENSLKTYRDLIEKMYAVTSLNGRIGCFLLFSVLMKSG